MKSKKILIISQYFYPEDFRINDIAVELAQHDYQVTVLTAIPNYPHGSFFDGYGLFSKRKENYKGVNVIRLPIIPRGRSKFTLILNYLSFVFSGFFWMLFSKTKVDFVFSFEVSPMTQALIGVWFSKKHKVPNYLYAQDLWPESVEAVLGIKNKLIIKPIEIM
ncbi:MAG: glycosyltransferase family 4 protein, partial [Lentisphaeria bacterium]